MNAQLNGHGNLHSDPRDVRFVNQVFLLSKRIRNPIWPPWPLIGWHILNFFSRTAEGIYSKLATRIPYEVLTKCCYF